jgi:peptide/nickel transport system ATP-binding protein
MNRVPFVPAKGEIPNPLNPPAGCAFSPRCPYVQDVCRREPIPELESHVGEHLVRCWRADEIVRETATPAAIA